MSNIFELTDDYANVLKMIDEGWSMDALQDTLDAIKVDMDTKVDNTVGLIKSLEGDIETIDKEVKRLQGEKKRRDGVVKRLKDNLRYALDVQDKPNYRTSKNYIYKRNNAPSKNIIDEKLIPKDYWVSQAPKLNAKQLVDDLKSGKEIPGVELKQTVSLVVK
ncbi:siphovirus Gp157 family protein [Staphylococcus auricularis]|uniref:siphovirus Gp157 family protein n=1 Tax=Staphylococcus auricularis TaxID=29379 RepID=UPI001933479C|nr:siphovirus Gp157 family protein [Staphylococcus auricularis]MBM0868934.1 siphovirus superfamily [Staphylococcus auricularis]